MWNVVKDDSDVFSKLLMLPLDVILVQIPTYVLPYSSQQIFHLIIHLQLSFFIVLLLQLVFPWF